MADLIKLSSKLTFPNGKEALVTLVNSGSEFEAVIMPADDKLTAQQWRRDARSVREPNGIDWVGYTFSIPTPNHQSRQALSYSGRPNERVSAAPFDPQNRNQIWRLAYQMWPYSVIGMFDPVHNIFLDVFGGKIKEQAQIYAFDGTLPNPKPNQIWKMEYLDEVPGVTVPSAVAVARRVNRAAMADPNYFTLLFSNPAAVFEAAGHKIPREHHDAFNEYFRSHEGTKAIHEVIAGKRSSDSYNWSCFDCELACWAVAISIVALGITAVAVLTEGSAVVVELAVLVDVSERTALVIIQVVLGTGVFTLEVIISKICAFIGLC